MIVGHKIAQYLTIERPPYGGPYEVTTHRAVTELHSTKGWRPAGHTRDIQRVRHLPSPKAQQDAHFVRFVPASAPKERKPDFIDTMSPAARERAVMRHKVRRVEIQRAKNLAAARAVA